MVDRILIELDGSDPKFRVSRPGKSVHSTNPQDFILREDTEVYRGTINGSIAFTGNGTVNVDISALEPPVFVSLRSSDNAPQGSYFAIMAGTVMGIRNAGGVARTVYYSVFGNKFGG